MKCVVLLGFSTTGKSTILSHFQEHHREALETIDSDTQISQADGGHIYNIFLHYRQGGSTTEAISTIENREREFLRTVMPTTNQMLIASGPFLPIRQPDWRNFLDRVCPVCFYLDKEPEDVLDGLLWRRTRHLKDIELASNPGFGCWDQGVTTDYRDGRWVELDRVRALANVRSIMSRMVQIYRDLATRTFTWHERQTPKGQEQLNRAICQELGIGD